MKGLGYLAAACTAVCFSSNLRSAIIDFEADTIGFKPNGYSAVGHPTVTFTDTVGTGLEINNFGFQGMGTRSLAVHGDTDGSRLQIDFSVPVTFLSLAFGNDDPGWTVSTDRAWLEIWNSGSFIAAASVVPNFDDVMNQTISYSGGPFNRAFFWYGDSLGNPSTGGGQSAVGLIEVVDQIEYTAVPEPASTLATAALLGLGAFGLRRWRNRT